MDSVPPPPPASTLRDFLAREALALIPSILTQEDRAPHSPTFGCFDRGYWHQRTIDFPSGATTESVWPVALAYSLAIPGSPYCGSVALKQWVEAAIRYAARSAHTDGACDETFPLDRSPGANAASLLACVEAYSLAHLNDAEMLEFFAHRADWLAAKRGDSRDAAQLALVSLSLHRAGLLLDTERWKEPEARSLARVLSLQDDEGWFPENRGADPGNHTFVLGLLAQLYRLAPSHDLRLALTRGIAFAAAFVNPDHTFGGEYGSRGSSSFFPHGFEIVGEWLPEAPGINDQVLPALDAHSAERASDPSVLARRCWSWLLAWQHWTGQRPPVAPRPAGRHYYKNAGLLIDRRDGCELYVALNKGGVFKLWRDGAPVASDSQVSLQVRKGSQFGTAVASHVGKYSVHLDGHAIVIKGRFAFLKSPRMNTARLILGRMSMATVGRIIPGIVRRYCKGGGEAKKRSVPFHFTRSLTWSNGRLHVTDEVRARNGWSLALAVGIGALEASASRAFQHGQMQPWQDFTEQMHQLPPDAPLVIERVF